MGNPRVRYMDPILTVDWVSTFLNLIFYNYIQFYHSFFYKNGYFKNKRDKNIKLLPELDLSLNLSNNVCMLFYIYIFAYKGEDTKWDAVLLHVIIRKASDFMELQILAEVG